MTRLCGRTGLVDRPRDQIKATPEHTVNIEAEWSFAHRRSLALPACSPTLVLRSGGVFFLVPAAGRRPRLVPRLGVTARSPPPALTTRLNLDTDGHPVPGGGPTGREAARLTTAQ